MKPYKTLFALVLVCLLSFGCLFLSGCNQEAPLLDPENPTVITVWSYYTGTQLEAFNAHVEEFNRTRGKELGILVEASSEGSVSDLENNVIAAAQKEVVPRTYPIFSPPIPIPPIKSTRWAW